ncbi:MAG: putative 2OG-Fe(II) oxygenase [Wenzhouxiangella sp.]
MNITPNFAVPIIETRHPDPDGLNRRLRDLVLAREGPDIEPAQAVPTLKYRVFESHFRFFAWTEPCVQELRQYVIGNLVQAVKALSGYTDGQMARLRVHNHTWFHITRSGGYASSHNHPMASWSSVYCIDGGDQDGVDNPDSGILRFADTNPTGSVFLDPGNMHLKRPFNHGSINYRLEPGQLLIFPSWLMHEVTPYQGKRERITVASNFWFSED